MPAGTIAISTIVAHNGFLPEADFNFGLWIMRLVNLRKLCLFPAYYGIPLFSGCAPIMPS